MIYRVVIIDNGNQVSLTQQGGVKSIEGAGDILVDTEIMDEALEKLKKAVIDERRTD